GLSQNSGVDPALKCQNLSKLSAVRRRGRRYHRPMAHARRRRSIAAAAFALLALGTQLLGRSVTIRVARLLPVEPLATPTTPYYPFLLAGLKVVVALAVAALVWRLLRAQATALAAEQLGTAIGHRLPRMRPRFRLRLSARIWAASFAATS